MCAQRRFVGKILGCHAPFFEVIDEPLKNMNPLFSYS